MPSVKPLPIDYAHLTWGEIPEETREQMAKDLCEEHCIESRIDPDWPNWEGRKEVYLTSVKTEHMKYRMKHMKKTMKTWEIWSEGYSATGQSSGATLLGSFKTETFDEAVGKLEITPQPEQQPDKTWTFWGCRLFDNERDARRSFG